MRDDLLYYYEQELGFVRQMAVQFAQKYPKVASRLMLEPEKCEDPHVERLLEGFAFLAARVHKKLDDEFPEIAEALLSVVYPHFSRPVPSMSIVQLELDPDQGKLTSGLKVERGSLLYSKPVGGVPCKFQTGYETTIYPISVSAAEWRTPDRLDPPIKSTDAVAAIRLELTCGPDVVFSKLDMDRLRFYLSGDSKIVYKLYELLDSRVTRILVRDPARPRSRPVEIPASRLRPVGFEEDEALLPYPRTSFVGYRLLQEFFTFPEKFLFFDLDGLNHAWGSGFASKAEIVFLIGGFEGEDLIETLERGINARTFRLGCAPIINLFPQDAEGILLTERKPEYPVIPDIRRPLALEVHSIEKVRSFNLRTQETIEYHPFYSFRHRTVKSKQQAFWVASRTPSQRPNDQGTDVGISLIDMNLRPVDPDADTLHVRVICTNRDLPGRLPFGDESGDFELESTTAIQRIRTLKKPTVPLRPPSGRGIQWELISHLSLNYLSLVYEGREALQQILRLYDFAESAFSKKMIDGILRVESQRSFARVLSENGISFAKGTRVEVEFDEEQFVGAGVYLFASVIERFLALYASINSFSQFVARTRQRKEVLREWPPRAGRRVVL